MNIDARRGSKVRKRMFWRISRGREKKVVGFFFSFVPEPVGDMVLTVWVSWMLDVGESEVVSIVVRSCCCLVKNEKSSRY